MKMIWSNDRRLAAGLVALVACLAGCPSGEPGTATEPNRDSGPSPLDTGADATMDDTGADTTEADTADSALVDTGFDAGCGASAIQCGTSCVDPKTDLSNCGSCGNACMSGQTCSGGGCACRYPTSTSCSGTCVDVTSDTNNCGACGNKCSGATPVCSNGSCVASCNTASGQTACGASCVLLGSDPNNCGACGKSCATSELCSGGVCVPRVTIDPIGCADGTREHFADVTKYPNIAACRGGWDGKGGTAGYTGTFPAPLRTGDAACAKNGNSSPTNANGKGCSSIDLCAAGWHLCAGGEVQPRTGGLGCKADTWPSGSFYAAAIGSTGCYVCALTTGTVTGSTCTNASCAANCQANPGLTNDIFGCGKAMSVSASVCDVDQTGNDLCAALTASGGWKCGTDGVRESVNAVFDPSATATPSIEGGVLCCRDM